MPHGKLKLVERCLRRNGPMTADQLVATMKKEGYRNTPSPNDFNRSVTGRNPNIIVTGRVFIKRKGHDRKGYYFVYGIKGIDKLYEP